MPLPTPYDGTARLFQIGTRPLDATQWLEPDDAMGRQLAEKVRLMRTQPKAVFAEQPQSRPAQAELLAMLAAYLPGRFPQFWQRRGEAMHVAGSDEPIALDHDIAPLWTAARLVQDDLLLLERDAEGWRLTAASLCFPSSWQLAEKMGQVLDTIHAPVPGFGPGSRAAQIMARMFDAARPDTPMLRWNYSLYGDERLFHLDSTGPGTPRFGPGGRADPVVLRVERQTLRKLPETGAMAFTIRISLDPLEALAAHPDARRITASLRAEIAALTEEQLDYKGLTLEKPRLLERLAEFAAPED